MASSTWLNSPVPEVLNRNNYETWRSRMEAYLLAEDLWEVIEEIREPAHLFYKAWKRKNAKALYAIHNSCGPVMFQFVSETKMAKLAWEVLQDFFKLRARVEDSESFQPYIEFTKFTDFVTSGKWEKAKECLRLKGLDLHRAVRAIDTRDEHRDSAIHVAAREGHLTIVKELMLLMTHEDLKRGNAYGNTALHLAAINGEMHIVNELVLLMREKVNNDGNTALHSSVLKENVDIVNELVQSMRQTDLEIKNKEDHTALHLAVKLGNVVLVKSLADLIGKVRGPDGDTALHMAVKLGAITCVKELVLSMKGEDLRIKNDEGYTALHLAVNMANMSILKEFMPKYEERNLCSRTSSYHQFTSFVREAKWDDAKNCLAELDDPCDALAVVHPTYLEGFNALQIAAIEAPAEVVKEWISLLQERQDNLELKSTEDFKGFVQGIKLADVTDLQVVMENAKYMVEQYEKTVAGILEVQDSEGCTALVPLMTEEGLEIQDNNGSPRGGTALHLALYKENVDAAKELASLMTEEGLEIQDNNGLTPLLVAVNKGLTDMVKVLVPKMRQTGLEIKTYKEGQNALQHAIGMKHLEIAKEVIPHMRKEALEETDREGYTALGLALTLVAWEDEERMELAKCMAECNPKVFGIDVPKSNWIPVSWVLGDWKLCRYLYRLTPSEYLMPKHGTHGAYLMIECIRAKEFDMVMEMLKLKGCSRLDIIFARNPGAGKWPPIMELARTSCTSASETQLGFWRRFIYDRLRMEHADPSTCYSNNNITQEENNQDNRIDLEENNQEDNVIDLEENNQDNVIGLDENNQDNRTDLSHSGGGESCTSRDT